MRPTKAHARILQLLTRNLPLHLHPKHPATPSSPNTPCQCILTQHTLPLHLHPKHPQTYNIRALGVLAAAAAPVLTQHLRATLPPLLTLAAGSSGTEREEAARQAAAEVALAVPVSHFCVVVVLCNLRGSTWGCGIAGGHMGGVVWECGMEAG